jgi:hypothetical protein
MIEASSYQKGQQQVLNSFPDDQQQQYSKEPIFQKILKNVPHTTVLLNQKFECPQENIVSYLERNIYRVEVISYISKGVIDNFNRVVDSYGNSVYEEEQRRQDVCTEISNLSAQIQQNTDVAAVAKIRKNITELQEEYSKLSQVITEKFKDSDFRCTHLSLNALFNWCNLSKIVNFEEFKTCSLFRTYNSESNSYELDYQRSFEKMEGLYNKIADGCFYSSFDRFYRKVNLQGLIDLIEFFNIQGYSEEADKIDDIVKDCILAGYSLNEKLVNIPAAIPA